MSEKSRLRLGRKRTRREREIEAYRQTDIDINLFICPFTHLSYLPVYPSHNQYIHQFISRLWNIHLSLQTKIFHLIFLPVDQPCTIQPSPFLPPPHTHTHFFYPPFRLSSIVLTYITSPLCMQIDVSIVTDCPKRQIWATRPEVPGKLRAFGHMNKHPKI